MIIKSLGLEIRKPETLDSLYEKVDSVLENNGFTGNNISTEVKVQTVAHALQDMLQPHKHFSVCTIDECAEVSGVCISYERRKIYQTIHCLNWSKMLPEYRQMIIAMILDDFRLVLTNIRD